MYVFECEYKPIPLHTMIQLETPLSWKYLPAVPSDVKSIRANGRGATPETGSVMMTQISTEPCPSVVV